MNRFLSPEDASKAYELASGVAQPSSMEQILAREGIASIEMPLSAGDFERLSQGYALCLQECPTLLSETTQVLDPRFGAYVGHSRKEQTVDERTGQQVSDPKSLFHFSEHMAASWQARFTYGPKILRDFLADGHEIQDALIGVAKREIAGLDDNHPNISRLYFADQNGNPASYTFMRLLRYDGYHVSGDLGAVAKPHYDIGGVTLQAYADAEGFWGAPSGSDQDRTYFDTQEGKGYLFLGKGHEKVYGTDDSLRPLWHGVDRILSAGVTYVPERTAVVLFVNAPAVDYGVKHCDTVPYAFERTGL